MSQGISISDSGMGGEEDRPMPGPVQSFKQRAVESVLTVAGGQVISQGIRFGANLLLTRMFLPEVFGIMALIQTLVVGVNLFSDMGIGANIINHKRGGEQRFVNTVWTVSIIRGFFLWGLIAIFAYPVAWLWGEPQIAPMMIVVGGSYAIMPFESMGMRVLCRDVRNRRMVAEEILTQLIVTSFILFTAYFIWRSVWVLVIASLVNGVVHVGLTYAMWPSFRNWFAWDREAVHEILKFGVWIFLSSGVTWVQNYSDKAVLGGLVTVDEIGIYAIAYALANMGIQVIRKLGNQTLFPVYSRLSERGVDHLRRNTFRIRLGLLLLLLPPVWLLAVFGDHLVWFLYPAEYHEAGWMLRLIAIGTVGVVVNQTAVTILLAKRDSKRYMFMQQIRASLFLAGLIVGGKFWGLEGAIIGMVVAQLSEYPVLVWAIRPHKVWLPTLDLVAFAISWVVISLGWVLFPLS